nr:MAG TPA: hypothetical protein [Caudoviricetes sp.]
MVIFVVIIGFSILYGFSYFLHHTDLQSYNCLYYNVKVMIFKLLQKQYVMFFLVGHRPTQPTIAIFRHFCRSEQYLTYRPIKNSFDIQNLH